MKRRFRDSPRGRAYPPPALTLAAVVAFAIASLWGARCGDLGEGELGTGAVYEKRIPAEEESAAWEAAPTPVYSGPAFPDPVPQWTSRLPLNDKVLGLTAGVTLGQTFKRVKSIMKSAGMSEWSVYVHDPGAVGEPRGFVVVARGESIQDDGLARPGKARWDFNPGRWDFPGGFSVSALAEALAGALPGRYRVIALVVTNASTSPGAAPPSLPAATKWSSSGPSFLPWQLEDLVIERIRGEALIYEFYKVHQDAKPVFVEPTASSIKAKEHLTGAGILPEEEPRND